ncbi:MAG TPA: fibronectin type III domain-containing protein [candidate division Zixibacteria bacterium]|nr:fibronectin type III domain-containing protein [candidate division Zixibacteria bacterium]
MKRYKWIFLLGLILIVVIPVMAEKPPDAGGGDIPDTGELFGDLYVILRNESGVPMLDVDGCVQPISSMDGIAEVNTADGVITITAVEGEPFTLATYTDTAGDLVECELTEAMADWAQAVDFGRLNLGRAPQEVIDHAFDEAIKAMNDSTAIGIDPVGRLVLTRTDDTIKTIDSPAENLALYIKMMTEGEWITEDTTSSTRSRRPGTKGPPEGDGPSTEPRPVLTEKAIGLLDDLEYGGLGVYTHTNAALTNHELLLGASLLAAAADKSGGITLDKVVYINSIYGINQVGTLGGEVEGKTYFDFTLFKYDRGVFESRGSEECETDGWIWVLQPELVDGSELEDHFITSCKEILAKVQFTDMVELYETVQVNERPLDYDFIDNVRGFTQAADDALQVLEYIHNYKVPEVLYTFTGPTGLEATVVAATTAISLTWQDNSVDETFFFIERSLDGSTAWEKVGWVEFNVTEYVDSSPACELNYYRVRAYRESDGQYSIYSDVDYATMPACPMPPTDLEATVVDATTAISLTWQDNSSDETQFIIERSPDATNDWQPVGAVVADITEFVDSSPGCELNYYRVRAYRESDGQYSIYSDVAYATMPVCPTPTEP